MMTRRSRKLRITGDGSTSATSALSVQNSAATETLLVRDDGEVVINKDSTVTTQSSAVISVQSADTNTNIVLNPKGTGAIIAGPPPTGLASGGSARGVNAIDLQTARDNASQIASGLYSVLSGGYRNTASNAYAVVGGGELNTASGSKSGVFSGDANVASGTFSAIVGGSNAIGNLYGQQPFAAGRFSVASDAQRSALVFRRLCTDTVTTELFLDGASAAAILPLPTGATNARVWEFQVRLTAIVHTVGNGTVTLNDALGASYRGTIKRLSSGTTALVGTVQQIGTTNADASMSTSVITIDANDTNDSLRIQFTPPSTAGSTTEIRVVASVDLVEVGR